MPTSKTMDEFIDHYQKGARIFTNLEFENGESFRGLDIHGTIFKNCWLCVDFSNANLTDCQFIESNIKTSNFSNANLTRAIIKECTIDGTVYNGSTITDLIFDSNFMHGIVLNFSDFKRINGFKE
jgi:uncharacterized protein YjbI with pentapeptide repeats